MKCSRCATELSDSATFCPRCGLSTALSHPSTFTYLPPGTPAWPTSVPTDLPNVVNAITPQQQTSPRAKAKKENKSKRSLGNLIAIVAVLLIPALIGAAITYVTLSGNRTTSSQAAPAPVNANNSKPATPVTTSPNGKSLPTPTSFKTAKDTNVNISLQYPADWTAQPPQQSNSSTALGIDSQGQIGIHFLIAHMAANATSSISSTDELAKLAIQSLNQYQDIHNLQHIQATNSQPSIDGAKGSAQEVTFTDGNSTKIHFTSMAFQHGQSYYIINYYMPDNIYQEAMQKYITPMLTSIKFLS